MKTMLIILLLLPNIVLSQNASQSGCCVDSLVINTGYDPTTGLAIPYGADSAAPVLDPKWIVSSISPAAVTAIAAMGGYTSVMIDSNADVVSPSGAWVVNPVGYPGHWISYLNGNGYTTPGTYGDPIYYATLGRPFTMCSDDSIKLNLYLSGDNWIQETDIDSSISLTFSQPATDAVSHFSTATFFTQTVWLTAGTHVLHVKVQNYTSGILGNGTGIDVYGTLNSASGANSLKAESSYCDSSALSGSLITRPQPDLKLFPNPVYNELTISSSNKITIITISNFLGQSVYTNQYNSAQVQVDVANLPVGVYIVKINGSEVRKFVKL